ncbi:hypothetical protein EBX93_07710, partial [bacterium]|nr:hypothetical protein [bacterium]
MNEELLALFSRAYTRPNPHQGHLQELDQALLHGEFNEAGDGIMIGNILTNFGQRNAAFATSGVTFLCDDSIVIGTAPSQPVLCNEVWIQGQQFNPYNFGTNRIIKTNTSTVDADLNYDIYIVSTATPVTFNLP